MVEVWRTIEANTRTVGAQQWGTFLRSRLARRGRSSRLGGERPAGSTRLSPLTEVQANAGLAAALKMRRLSIARADG